jgi:hypothetical protein
VTEERLKGREEKLTVAHDQVTLCSIRTQLFLYKNEC